MRKRETSWWRVKNKSDTRTDRERQGDRDKKDGQQHREVFMIENKRYSNSPGQANTD